MIGRGALVVEADAGDREVIVRVATDVVMQERVTRRVVLRESLRLLSVVGLAEVAGTLRLYLKMDSDSIAFHLFDCDCYWPPT
jgi:hypothetical protein